MSLVKERVLYFIETKGISRREFCRQVEVSSAFLANDSEIATDKLFNIYTKYPELNLEWLVAGEGEMLRNEDKNDLPQKKNQRDPRDIELIKLQEKHIATLDERILELKEKIEELKRLK